MGAQHGWQLPGQCREDGTVGPIRLGPGDRTPEHRDLTNQGLIMPATTIALVLIGWAALAVGAGIWATLTRDA